MNLVRTVHYEGREVRPGATWTLRLDNQGFRGRLRCTAAEPEAYVAELLLGDAVLLETAPQPRPEDAERALQNLIKARVRTLFDLSAT